MVITRVTRPSSVAVPGEEGPDFTPSCASTRVGRPSAPTGGRVRVCSSRATRVAGRVLVLFTLWASSPSGASEMPQRAYQEARGRFQKNSDDSKAAWEFGRACFDLAQTATNKAQRAEIAEQGIAACRKALATESNSVAAHYYLGLNLGQLARTRGLSALKIIKEMEQEWTTAARLDPGFDHAGPERSLGMLYRDAPALASVGSRSKSRQRFSRAIEQAPHYPENRLEFIEAYLKWGDEAEAGRELKALEKCWAAARAELAGPEWAESWKNWEAQLQRFKTKIAQGAKVDTPRHQ
jgi:tetratricopeptide (TPR) repeat protein